MKTTDLFKVARSAKRLNESLAKTFGKKLNLESFDLPQLEDARNKLRTQLYTVRTSSKFNENLENEAYTEGQWMLDAINAEIAERQEFIANSQPEEVDEESEWDDEIDEAQVDELQQSTLQSYAQKALDDENYSKRKNRPADVVRALRKIHAKQTGVSNDQPTKESAPPGAKAERMVKHIKKGYAKDGKLSDKERGIAYATAWKQHNKNESIQGDNMKEGWQRNPERGAEYARAANFRWDTDPDEQRAQQTEVWTDEIHDLIKSKNIKVPSDQSGIEQLADKIEKYMSNSEYSSPDSEFIIGVLTDLSNDNMKEGRQDNTMSTLRESEIQQAQSIVTAKTMVDRVGRWIEELSGMENDTLLQLGDQVRDEMSSEQAKTYISTVAPAIQQALDTLKSTRETLATGVRMLTGEEQGAEMLGSEPQAEPDGFGGAAEPDAMNLDVPAEDEFAAAEPAAGGIEAAGRAKRESIERSNNLLKMLAG